MSYSFFDSNRSRNPQSTTRRLSSFRDDLEVQAWAVAFGAVVRPDQLDLMVRAMEHRQKECPAPPKGNPLVDYKLVVVGPRGRRYVRSRRYVYRIVPDGREQELE